jgi:hypothetical protein
LPASAAIESAMEIDSPARQPLPPLMRVGGELSPAAVEALCAHPRFAAAMRALLADNVRLYRGKRILNYVGYDRGRLIVGILALYLHVGLEHAREPGVCARQRLTSP